MARTFWECAKLRQSCRKRYRLNWLKNNKAPGTDSVVNEFLKYGGSEVRNKLLKIMSMIFQKGKVTKTSIKPLYKKGDETEYGNY